MGYSCTKAASDTLHTVSHLFDSHKKCSTLILKGKEYFFERGRENSDGAITGSLMLLLPDGYCRNAGSVRIGPNGEITKFPGLTKADRLKVEEFIRVTPGSNPRLWSQVQFGRAL